MGSKSRVQEYKDLREQIENIDVYSFDDPKRLPASKMDDLIPIHDYSDDPPLSDTTEDHIKKNTLSLSIDELIKQHESYVEAQRKEEMSKKIKSSRAGIHKNRLRLKINIHNAMWILIALAILAFILVIGLIIGGVI